MTQDGENSPQTQSPLHAAVWSLADLWVRKTLGSYTTLGSRCANDTKIFSRMAAGYTISINVFARMMAFFAAPQSWPGEVVPEEVVALVGRFEGLVAAPQKPDDDRLVA